MRKEKAMSFVEERNWPNKIARSATLCLMKGFVECVAKNYYKINYYKDEPTFHRRLIIYFKNINVLF